MEYYILKMVHKVLLVLVLGVYSGSIPNVSFPVKNAIYGVYQDLSITPPTLTNSIIQNINYNVFGTTPNRVFVVNFNELPFYQCNNSVGLQSSQIVLYETSNIIDVNIKNKSVCSTWNGGVGLVGIQNDNGTVAHFPSNRNTGNWSTTNESWRFLPNGNSMTTFEWYKNGVLLGTSNPITLCPENGDNLQAIVTYNNCGGQNVISSSKILNIQPPINANTPTNMSACVDQGINNAVFDLTSNQAIYGLNLTEYSFLLLYITYRC